MSAYRVFDLFCGTGGFSKGFENDGRFAVAFGIDSLRVAADTFRLNHPGAFAVAGDIRAIPPAEIANRLAVGRGEVDVIIGGPPCQGFSSIRPHRSSNSEDARNSLFHDFAAYVDFFRPPVFVLENVIGLATFGDGRTIEAMQERFGALGYTTDWRILNAAHFGIPQKRERLVMLGAERGLPLSFPTSTHFCNLDTIGHRDKQRLLVPDLFTVGSAPLAPAVTVADAIDDLPPIRSGERTIAYGRPPRTAYQTARRQRSHHLMLHDSTAHSARMLEIIRHSGPNISHIPPTSSRAVSVPATRASPGMNHPSPLPLTSSTLHPTAASIPRWTAP